MRLLRLSAARSAGTLPAGLPRMRGGRDWTGSFWQMACCTARSTNFTFAHKHGCSIPFAWRLDLWTRSRVGASLYMLVR
ncbi:hypothetical protein Micbo1qcDRAFT_69316 [Microdochium bolleyi]|uniref:Uncharacterized protein n=1 Tax=Microdochium bolleyi TaxID=196109 RepID=A0A136J1P7_9PEZI|nr:hypothetical protein Micbo1qcDRAFT_69316 [Microdochium bolleyi]